MSPPAFHTGAFPMQLLLVYECHGHGMVGRQHLQTPSLSFSSLILPTPSHFVISKLLVRKPHLGLNIQSLTLSPGASYESQVMKQVTDCCHRVHISFEKGSHCVPDTWRWTCKVADGDLELTILLSLPSAEACATVLGLAKAKD